jgi:hypothetical protein
MCSAAAGFNSGRHVTHQLAPGLARGFTVCWSIAANVDIQHNDRPAI